MQQTPQRERRSVRLCVDAPSIRRGTKTGAVKLAAYGYAHLAHLLGLSEREVRGLVGAQRLRFDSLASIVTYCAADTDRLDRVRALAQSQPSVESDGTNRSDE